MVLQYRPVDGSVLTDIGRVTDQTFPLLVILHHLEILPAEVPADALATEGVGTEVTEVDLTPLRAPPATPIISRQSHGRDLQSQDLPAELIISLFVFVPASPSVLTLALAAHQNS